eukprot:scaffold26915_cov71-Attheya_sp.AAC.6
MAEEMKEEAPVSTTEAEGEKKDYSEKRRARRGDETPIEELFDLTKPLSSKASGIQSRGSKPDFRM